MILGTRRAAEQSFLNHFFLTPFCVCVRARGRACVCVCVLSWAARNYGNGMGVVSGHGHASLAGQRRELENLVGQGGKNKCG